MAQVILILHDETDYQGMCFIGVALSAEHMLNTIQLCSALPVTLIHSFEAHHRAENVLRTLKIEFAEKCLHDNWFQLSKDDIAFIKSINENNFRELIPELEYEILKQTHPEKFLKKEKVKKERKPRVKKVEELSIDELEVMRQQLLDKAHQGLTMFVCRRKAS